jgi:4-methyl-5(b-hydroxyethyl)-thiazole monophosphate biosynthesis
MVYILLADGFEEVEALEPADILRRCGLEVALVGITGKTVTGAHQIKVEADLLPGQVNEEQMECLLLPGGPGHELLDASNAVHGLINTAISRGCVLGAICAAPSILGKKHLLEGKKATCFPGYEKYLYGAEVTGNKVETASDGKLITAKGAGAAAGFGFAVAAQLCGAETAEKIKGMMQY